MYLGPFVLIADLVGTKAGRADELTNPPSLPESWPVDLRDRIEPTPDCIDGTVESLRKRVGVFDGFLDVKEFQVASKEDLSKLVGLLDGDSFHQVLFRADLPDGTFWGFGGFVVVREGCVIHAEISSHYN